MKCIFTYFVSDVLNLTCNILKLGLDSSPFNGFQFFALPIRPPSNIFPCRWCVHKWGKEEEQTQYGVKPHCYKLDLFYTSHVAPCCLYLQTEFASDLVSAMLLQNIYYLLLYVRLIGILTEILYLLLSLGCRCKQTWLFNLNWNDYITAD